MFTWLWKFFLGLPGWLWGHPFEGAIFVILAASALYVLALTIAMAREDVQDIKRRNPDR